MTIFRHDTPLPPEARDEQRYESPWVVWSFLGMVTVLCGVIGWWLVWG